MRDIEFIPVIHSGQESTSGERNDRAGNVESIPLLSTDIRTESVGSEDESYVAHKSSDDVKLHVSVPTQ